MPYRADTGDCPNLLPVLVNFGCQHVSKCVIQSFYQPLTLRVIGRSPGLVYVQQLAYSLYNAEFKLASLVRVELFWYGEPAKEFLDQRL